ncbi:MAG: hypothetical protein C4336_03430 [Armatimonadota bacterium]
MEGWKPPFLPALEGGGFRAAATVNADGCVDDADLLAVLYSFGQRGCALEIDPNRDGSVDDADLLTVLFAFGQGW